MNRASVVAALQTHLPANAVDYCIDLWERNNFVLRIKNPRRSKLGDYRYVPSTGRHYISVNNDLNPYAFLITYLHEVAHLLTFRTHGRRVKPHGMQWKRCFRDITYPVMTPSVFPGELLERLTRYLRNPAASSCADPALMEALRAYDADSLPMLKELAEGEVFRLHTRSFRKGKLKRTRYVCQEVRSGKSYLISGHAMVSKEDQAPIRR